jgi:hypothetical protein
MPPLPYPALALHAKVVKFGCTRSLRGDGVAFFSNFFCGRPRLKFWKYGMVRWSGLSEKQTHRKLSGSVGLGQFSTQSGP